MHPIIEQHRSAVEAACRKYGVRRLEVFGSAARGNDFDEARSDIDVIAEFVRPGPLRPALQYFGFKHCLEDLFQRHVDVTEPSGFKSRSILKSVDVDRSLVYAMDD